MQRPARREWGCHLPPKIPSHLEFRAVFAATYMCSLPSNSNYDRRYFQIFPHFQADRINIAWSRKLKTTGSIQSIMIIRRRSSMAGFVCTCTALRLPATERGFFLTKFSVDMIFRCIYSGTDPLLVCRAVGNDQQQILSLNSTLLLPSNARCDVQYEYKDQDQIHRAIHSSLDITDFESKTQ